MNERGNMDPIDKNQLAPPKQSFRTLFLTIGIALVGVAGVFYLRRFMGAPENVPPVVLAIPGGIGLLLIVIGLLCPRPQAPATAQPSERDIREAEIILKRGPANYSRRWEKAGGHLCLTNQRLAFLGHGINIQDADVSIPLAEIEAAEKAGAADFIRKPFSLRRLLEGVHRALDQSPAESADETPAQAFIRCRCPSCGARIRAAVYLLGQTQTCPGCQTPMLVRALPPTDAGPMLALDDSLPPRRGF